MAKLYKVAMVLVLGVVAFFGLMGAKWYNTTTREPIDLQRGIFGMPGLEIWIDLNLAMPDVARQWACDTILAREAAATNIVRPVAAYPHGCQPDFAEKRKLPVNAYESMLTANFSQGPEANDPVKSKELRACFDAKIATEITPEDITTMNDSSDLEVTKKVVKAVSKAIRQCSFGE